MNKVLVKTTIFGLASFVLLFVKPAISDSEDTEQPSMEFLEFLGEFETQEGMWVDPLSLLDSDETDTETNSSEEDPEDE